MTALDSDGLKSCFSARLQEARKASGKNQAELGDLFDIGRVMIANYESGKATPEPARVVLLAEALGQDPAEFLLLADAQRSYDDTSPPPPLLLRTLNDLLEKSQTTGNPLPAGAKGLATHISLLDFPHRFRPMTIIVGDKREEEPRNAGDLFVFSASPVDDRWILDLGLPRGTEKLSDKVLMTADLNWLKATLGHRHILCIGSPASNLFAREYNDQFLFRFAISREAEEKWRNKRKKLTGRPDPATGRDDEHRTPTPAQLLALREEARPDLKQTMRLFKQPGFVDFNYENLKLGIDPADNRDFAVVSLGRNPFAEPGAPYFSILAAGVHHPGTAHAVKFLSDPSRFGHHPFGGILEVQVPRDDLQPEDVRWHNKVAYSLADWHKVSASRLEYQPKDLRNALEKLRKRLEERSVITDVGVSEEECDRHTQLIDLLAQAKGNA